MIRVRMETYTGIGTDSIAQRLSLQMSPGPLQELRYYELSVTNELTIQEISVILCPISDPDVGRTVRGRKRRCLPVFAEDALLFARTRPARPAHHRAAVRFFGRKRQNSTPGSCDLITDADERMRVPQLPAYRASVFDCLAHKASRGRAEQESVMLCNKQRF